MAKKPRKFDPSIKLKPSDDAITAEEGTIKVKDSDKKIKAYLDSAERSVVTEDQTQTIENKTIDGTAASGNNTITMDADDVTFDPSGSALVSTDVQAALEELQTNLEGQDEASEITFDPSGSALVSTTVQDAIEEVQTNLEGQDEASEISYSNATSGLTATDVQAAIDEVDGNLDTHIADTTAHGTTGNVVGTSDAQTLTNKSIDAVNNTITNIKDAEIASDADITRTKLAPGTADHVMINDATGEVSSEAQLSKSRGGTGADNSSVTFPTTGTIPTEGSTSTLTNKTIDANNNTISNLAHGSEVDNPSSGVHGVTGSVVGTTDTQTLTNKTINTSKVGTGTASATNKLVPTSDTKANLDGLTREAGSLYYSTDDQKFYGDDGTVLNSLGGAGGTSDQLAIVYEQYGTGINGGTPGAAGSWHTRALTGKEGTDSSIVTVASNQFTLSSGKYLIQAQSTFVNTGPTRMNIYNITDSAWQFNGVNATGAASANLLATVAGTLSLGSTKTFELRYQVGTATATIGLGSALSFTNTTIEGIERYTQIIITKIN